MPPGELLTYGAYILFMLGASALAAHRRRRFRRRVAVWREAARQAGLRTLGEWDDRVLSAKAGALRVRFSLSPSQEGGGTRLEIDGAGLASLTLRPEPRGLLASRNPRQSEVGDDDFDREVSVQGLSSPALAVLDPPTRHAVRTLLRGPFQPRGSGA